MYAIPEYCIKTCCHCGYDISLCKACTFRPLGSNKRFVRKSISALWKNMLGTTRKPQSAINIWTWLWTTTFYLWHELQWSRNACMIAHRMQNIIYAQWYHIGHLLHEQGTNICGTQNFHENDVPNKLPSPRQNSRFASCSSRTDWSAADVDVFCTNTQLSVCCLHFCVHSLVHIQQLAAPHKGCWE